MGQCWQWSLYISDPFISFLFCDNIFITVGLLPSFSTIYIKVLKILCEVSLTFAKVIALCYTKWREFLIVSDIVVMALVIFWRKKKDSIKENVCFKYLYHNFVNFIVSSFYIMPKHFYVCKMHSKINRFDISILFYRWSSWIASTFWISSWYCSPCLWG